MFRLPVVMMKFRLTRFNIYLVLALAGVWGAGCKTAEERQESSLRLHLEAPSYYNKTNVVAPIGRTRPFQVTVDREPFLFENNITAAWHTSWHTRMCRRTRASLAPGSAAGFGGNIS